MQKHEVWHCSYEKTPTRCQDIDLICQKKTCRYNLIAGHETKKRWQRFKVSILITCKIKIKTYIYAFVIELSSLGQLIGIHYEVIIAKFLPMTTLYNWRFLVSTTSSPYELFDYSTIYSNHASTIWSNMSSNFSIHSIHSIMLYNNYEKHQYMKQYMSSIKHYIYQEFHQTYARHF